MMDLEHVPVFGVCGYSGAGKTTLLLDLVSRLRSRGLVTVVVKHDAHGLDIDRGGKDSYRLFAAGADVFAHDGQQSFLRLHDHGAHDLATVLSDLQSDCDVILVEGHKRAALPRKLWLRRHARDAAPSSGDPFALDLGRDVDRGAIAWQWIDEELGRLHRSRPTWAGVLIGGQSSRMGVSKHLLTHRGRTWLARIVDAAREVAEGVVLLGAGKVPRSCAELPRLRDVPDKGGPLAGMCAAMRWHHDAHWLFLACDTPWLDGEALRWLLRQARPGIWAVLPRRSSAGAPEPFPGWYDSRARRLLERLRGPSGLARDARIAVPIVPPGVRAAWRDCDTPAQLRRVTLRDTR